MSGCAVSLSDYTQRRDGVCTLKDRRLILYNFSFSVLGEEGAHLHTLLLGEIQGNYLHWIYRYVGEKK